MFVLTESLAGPQLTIAVGLAVALILVAHAMLRWWLRRRERRAASRGRWWLSRSLRDCVPPLALLIWIHGLYVVFGMLLPLIPADGAAGRGAAALDWGYALALTGTFVWLLGRAGVIVEALLMSVSRQAGNAWDGMMLPLAGKAARRLLPLLALGIGVSALAVSPALEQILRNATIAALCRTAQRALRENGRLGS